jgi:hypothetical protein
MTNRLISIQLPAVFKKARDPIAPWRQASSDDGGATSSLCQSRNEIVQQPMTGAPAALPAAGATPEAGSLQADAHTRSLGSPALPSPGETQIPSYKLRRVDILQDALIYRARRSLVATSMNVTE